MLLVLWLGAEEAAGVFLGGFGLFLLAAGLLRRKKLPLMPFLAAAGTLRLCLPL